MSYDTATLRQDREGNWEVIDEHGDTWDYFTDDGNGNYAVERDAGERWNAAVYSQGTLSRAHEDQTFGVNCQDEFIVRLVDQAGSLRWCVNDPESV